MPWSTQIIADRAVDVFDPSSSIHFACLFLHDIDGSTPAAKMEWTRLLEKTGLICVCPHGKQSWWSSRIHPEFDPQCSAERFIVEQVTPWIAQTWSCGVGVAGVGMGGQGALRLAFKYPALFPVVAACDAAIDHHELYGSGTPLDEMYESREQCRQDTAGLHIHPSRHPPHIWFAVDPRSRWQRGNDRLHEKLAALGASHEFLPSAQEAEPERMLRFLAQALRQQSRRLL